MSELPSHVPTMTPTEPNTVKLAGPWCECGCGGLTPCDFPCCCSTALSELEQARERLQAMGLYKRIPSDRG